MNAPQQPPRRRRIAGESKPGEVSAPEVSSPDVAEVTSQRPTLAKPKLPKRPKPVDEPPAAVQTAGELVAQDEAAGATPEPPQPTKPLVSAEGAAPAPPATFGAGFYVLLALAVVSVGLAVWGVVSGVQKVQQADLGSSRADAADAAASASETIFTYQYNKLNEHLRASEATMTPTFARKFKEISPALNRLAPQRKIQVKAVVRNKATLECGDHCSPDKAQVLIFVDQARVALGDKEPTVFGNRIKVSMVKIDGKWLVSDIKAL